MRCVWPSSTSKTCFVNQNLRNCIFPQYFRYGGWYADLDTIFLRPLADLSPGDVDVISTDGYLDAIHGGRVDAHGHRILGGRVSNGLFRARRAGSRFLRLTMEAFAAGFDPSVWTSGGANAMATALREVCGVDEEKEGLVSLTGGRVVIPLNNLSFNCCLHTPVERISAERCDGLQLFDPKHFFPKSWFQAPELWSPPQ
jgi:hypothetical protein